MKRRRLSKPKKMKKKYIIKLDTLFGSIGDDMYREMSSNPVFTHLAELSTEKPIQTSHAFSKKQALSQFLTRVSNKLGYENQPARVVYRWLEGLEIIEDIVREVKPEYRKLTQRGPRQLVLKLY